MVCCLNPLLFSSLWSSILNAQQQCWANRWLPSASSFRCFRIHNDNPYFGLLRSVYFLDFLLSGDLFRIPNTQRQAFDWLTRCVPFFAFRIVFCSEYTIACLSSAFFSVFMSWFSCCLPFRIHNNSKPFVCFLRSNVSFFALVHITWFSVENAVCCAVCSFGYICVIYSTQQKAFQWLSSLVAMFRFPRRLAPLVATLRSPSRFAVRCRAPHLLCAVYFNLLVTLPSLSDDFLLLFFVGTPPPTSFSSWHGDVLLIAVFTRCGVGVDPRFCGAASDSHAFDPLSNPLLLFTVYR